VRRPLEAIASPRLAKFATVGASGVLVNLLVLGLCTRLGLQTNAAAALAIEVSILSNFFLNLSWTFRDRRVPGSVWREGARFHLVSLAGAASQFVVFVAMNAAWALAPSNAVTAGSAAGSSWVLRWLVRPVTDPPDVGAFIYVSQLTGIGCAMLWNYLLNFYWTWAASAAGGPRC
jgi:putative flippase GtrA